MEPAFFVKGFFSVGDESKAKHTKKSKRILESHCKKKVSDFPVPSMDVINQTPHGRD
jgi:hypothetical protein